MKVRVVVSVSLALLCLIAARMPTSAAEPGDETVPTVSPSLPGRLAFTTGHYAADFEGNPGGASMSQQGLGTIGLDGTDQRTLTEPDPEPADDQDLGVDIGPQWSPDGNWIAYTQSRPLPEGGGVASVALIPRDGGTPQVVSLRAINPTWSPDGRHLAWVALDTDGRSHIEIADVELAATSVTVTNQRMLQAPHPEHDISSLTFSPDGRTLGFANGSDYLRQVTLYLVTIDGDTLTQLSRDVSVQTQDWYRFEFSPRGGQLVFWGDTYPGGDRVIRRPYLVNTDGTDQRLLAPTDSEVTGVTWAPSGEMFAVITGSNEVGIRLLDVSGNDLGWITRGEFDYFQGLTFSPDGSTVYSVVSPPEARPWAPNLYAFPVDGASPQPLTTDQSVFPWSVRAIDPGAVVRRFGNGPAATAATTEPRPLISCPVMPMSARGTG